MSVYVSRAVWKYSRAEHGALLTLLAIADEAQKETGIAFPRQSTLAEMTRTDERTVRGSIRTLEDGLELETRQAVKKRTRINVYRVLLGEYADVTVDEDDLPFRLLEPFSTPAELANRRSKGTNDDRKKLPVVTAATTGKKPHDDRKNSPPLIGDGPGLVPTEDSENESSVPAADAAGERERLIMNLELALSVELGGKPVTRSEYGAWKRVVQDLADAGATVDEVRERCAAYRARWPRVVLTPVALARHWTLLGGLAQLEQTGGGDFARWIEKSAWRLEDEHVLDILESKQLARDAIETHLARCRQLRAEHTTANTTTAHAFDAAREAAA